MKITVCDICQKRDVREVRVTTGYEPDPAGGTQDVQFTVDLCVEDAVKMLLHLCHKDPALSMRFQAEVKRRLERRAQHARD